MKLTTTKSEIKSAIAMAASIAQQKSTLPILNHILFTAKEGSLQVLSSNTDIQMAATAMIADTAAAFNIAIPADRFSKVIANFDDGATITIEHADNKLTVKSGRSKSQFATLSASDFPIMDVAGTCDSFTLDQATFKNALAIVSKSSAVKDIRYYLNGVCLESDGKSLNIIGTDGHRCSVITMPIEANAFEFILSNDAIAQLLKVLNTGEVALQIYGEKIAFAGQDFTLTTKPLTGKFPNWRRVMPGMNGGASVDAATMKDCAIRAAVAAVMPRAVSCVLQSGVLTMTGGKPGDETSDSMDVALGDCEFGVNVDYVLDAVASFDEHFNFAANDKQLMFWHGELRIVVMAMRV